MQPPIYPTFPDILLLLLGLYNIIRKNINIPFNKAHSHTTISLHFIQNKSKMLNYKHFMEFIYEKE